jgi:hypothetical protein
MLSGETSVGEYPIVAVETMARILTAAEDHSLDHMRALDWNPRTTGGIIAKAALEVAERVGAKYLVAFTTSGDSARRLSRYRGPIPILAFTPEATTRSQLSLAWGVETFKTVMVEHTDEMVRQVDEQLLKIGRSATSSSSGQDGSTNACGSTASINEAGRSLPAAAISRSALDTTRRAAVATSGRCSSTRSGDAQPPRAARPTGSCCCSGAIRPSPCRAPSRTDLGRRRHS